jgi:hypothetical protein
MLPRRRCPSVVVGFILTRGSTNDKRPVVGPTVAASRSGNPISNGGRRTRITSAVAYEHQKEIYGTRSDYRRRYRQQHPDYVRGNAASVRKWRQRLRSAPVSSTSSDLHVTIESETTSIRIVHVSSTSRDIFVTLSPA